MIERAGHTKLRLQQLDRKQPAEVDRGTLARYFDDLAESPTGNARPTSGRLHARTSRLGELLTVRRAPVAARAAVELHSIFELDPGEHLQCQRFTGPMQQPAHERCAPRMHS